jgi:hypothetical protein
MSSDMEERAASKQHPIAGVDANGLKCVARYTITGAGSQSAEIPDKLKGKFAIVHVTIATQYGFSFGAAQTITIDRTANLGDSVSTNNEAGFPIGADKERDGLIPGVPGDPTRVFINFRAGAAGFLSIFCSEKTR